MKREKIIIFDTTLRDGEQSPGASLDVKQKLEIAQQLKNLGIDVIEAGFPVSSPGDFAAVQTIASEVEGPIICGLARALPKDIERCTEAIKSAVHSRLHTFIGTSPIHMKYQMKKSPAEILKMTYEAVKLARSLITDVEFSPMDATRTELNFLIEVISAAIEAGATTINIPDTVGYAVPEEFGRLIKTLRDRLPILDKVVISVHCHDDLGMATANSLAAVLNGARQIECTVNGIGERAGNASLEEVVMAIKTRPDFFHFTTGVETKEIYKTSRLVSHYTGLAVQANKAIVGSNAFAHSSGIHQDGILKERMTFEIMRPENVGVSESKIILTSRSGRHALIHKLEQLGYHLKDKELDKVYQRFKELADKKKEVFEEDILAVMEEETTTVPETYRLEYFSIITGNKTVPTATVRLKKSGKLFQEAAFGDGPVDACYKAIDKITGIKPRLLDYSLRSISSGKDALGEVTVKVEYKKQSIFGRGRSTDIIEASAKAYLDTINKIVSLPKKKPVIPERI